MCVKRGPSLSPPGRKMRLLRVRSSRSEHRSLERFCASRKFLTVKCNHHQKTQFLSGTSGKVCSLYGNITNYIGHFQLIRNFLLLGRFPANLELFGLSGNFPDLIDSFQFIEKLSGLSGNFQFIWKLSNLSG